jgi:hypothetical protein
MSDHLNYGETIVYLLIGAALTLAWQIVWAYVRRNRRR